MFPPWTLFAPPPVEIEMNPLGGLKQHGNVRKHVRQVL